MLQFHNTIKFITLKLLHLTNGRPLKTNVSGLGSILTFHRVVSGKISVFNGILEISESHFEKTIQYLIEKKYRFISLGQLYDILISGKKIDYKFIVVTFDDGYADNYHLAYPILKKYHIPFTIYITTDFPDKKSIVWWYLLEDIILANQSVEFEYQDQQFKFNCSDIMDKHKTFTEIREFILQNGKDYMEDLVNCIFKKYKTDSRIYSDKLAISWEQIIELSKDPLVTIGAHTSSHPALSKISEIEVFLEIINSRNKLESKINKKVEHFAYPFGSKAEYGSREINIVKNLHFKTAVNTLVGNIFIEHKNHLCSLPRVFISEQINQYALNVRLSGVYQYLTNKFKKIDICT